MAEGLRGLLRIDFARIVRPHFEKTECEICGSCTEHLHVHHMTHFQDLLDETLEQLHLEYYEDTDMYAEDELQLIRDVMIGKQMRIEYVTCCESCHLKLHSGNYFSKNKMTNVICLNTLDIFYSAGNAGKWCNTQHSSIHMCCKGKRPTAGKHPETGEQLKWMYYDDYLKATQQEIEDKMQHSGRGGGCKKVICLQTLQVFETGVDAARWCGVSRSAISLCCKGERKTCGKHPITGEPLKWKYYDEWLASAN